MARVVIRNRRRFCEGRPVRVSGGIRVAVRLSQADRCDGPPETVVIFGLEGADIAVRQREIQESKQARVFPQGQLPGSRNQARDAVPLNRRGLEPEQGDLGLLASPGAGRVDAVASQPPHLVVVFRIPVAVDGVGAIGRKLIAVPQHKGPHGTPLGQKREGVGRREAVLPRLGALWIGEVQHRLRVPSVGGAPGQDRHRGGLANGNAGGLRRAIRDRRQRVGVGDVQRPLLRGDSEAC